MQKIRVGVFMGGMSAEQEVSFNSGRTICDHLDTNRYTVIPIFQRFDGVLFILPYKFLHRGKISDFIDRLESEAELVSWDALRSYVDFLYLAVHGTYAEDGTLQGMLELLGIPYLGSRVYASAVCMDKIFAKKILSMHDIAVPRDLVVPAPVTLEGFADTIKCQLKEAELIYPLVVKPRCEGSSIGVSLVTNADMLMPALEKVWYLNPHKSQSALVEECITGMEFSCILLRDYRNNCWLPLPPTEVVPESHIGFFDYEQKYMPGRSHKFTPARCGDELIKKIQETCMRASDILEIRTISRIDGFLKADGTVVIIDPNTLSGMGPASFLFREAAECNMSHTDVINYLIETELYQYGMTVGFKSVHAAERESMVTHKKRVAVLFGGDSNEREISLESGRNIVYKLSPHRYTVMPLFVTEKMELYHINQSLLVRSSTHEISNLLDRAEKIEWSALPTLVDFVFIGLHGGKGENGAVQGALEMLKLPYNGSGVIASALCMDKYKTTELLRAHNIPTPRNMLISKVWWEQDTQSLVAQLSHRFGFPCIIKPHDDGCSVMVSRASNATELTDALNAVFSGGKEYALVEEFIQGMELTIGVIGNEKPYALPPSQAVAAGGILSLVEKFLPGAGQNITPAPLSAEAIALAQQTVVAAYGATGCSGYARIDCFYQDATQSPTGAPRTVILEINTLPALTPATCLFHQAAEIGIKPMELIDTIVQLGFEKHGASAQQKSGTAFTVEDTYL
jgi:UDP-N-acetylmuramate--alanine ligase